MAGKGGGEIRPLAADPVLRCPEDRGLVGVTGEYIDADDESGGGAPEPAPVLIERGAVLLPLTGTGAVG